ncbi:MAG: hypothetical protein ACLSA6_13975 [Holdemania massiliensis]
MKDKRSLLIYTMIWGVAVLILVVLFLENLGFAKVINYSGIVRGATQKLVKEELNNEPDDALIQYLDDILEGLQHGGGTYDLTLISARDYQYRLKQMRFAWNAMKEEIAEVRAGKTRTSCMKPVRNTLLWLMKWFNRGKYIQPPAGVGDRNLLLI